MHPSPRPSECGCEKGLTLSLHRTRAEQCGEERAAAGNDLAVWRLLLTRDRAIQAKQLGIGASDAAFEEHFGLSSLAAGAELIWLRFCCDPQLSLSLSLSLLLSAPCSSFADTCVLQLRPARLKLICPPKRRLRRGDDCRELNRCTRRSSHKQGSLLQPQLQQHLCPTATTLTTTEGFDQRGDVSAE